MKKRIIILWSVRVFKEGVIAFYRLVKNECDACVWFGK